MKLIDKQIKETEQSIDELVQEIKIYCVGVDKNNINYGTLIAFGQQGQRLTVSLNNLISLKDKFDLLGKEEPKNLL